MSAAHRSPLHARVHQRMRETFGEPEGSFATDHHWAIRPGKQWVAINVMLEAEAETPAAWVFDPFNQADGVMRTVINDEEALEDWIAGLEARVQRVTEKVLRAP